MKRHRLYVVLICTGCAAAAAGCALDLSAWLPAGSETTQPSAGQRSANEIVSVRFRNLTDREAVHVEFYATNDPLAVLPADLFTDAHLVTASVGLAGTGIIPPSFPDVIEFACTPTLTIGTLGGQFVDVESGEPHGRGVSRWAQEGPLGLCGSMVTFDFAFDGNAYTTTLSIGH